MATRSDGDIPAETIACTLAPYDQKERVKEWQALCQDALIDEVRGDGVSTTLWRDGTGTAERLEQLIEAERGCCSFLDFELERENAIIRLKTTFPPGAEAVLDLVFGKQERFVAAKLRDAQEDV